MADRAGFERLTTALADRYRIERELGQGGMATVYLAEDLKHDRKVALKVLKPELAAVLGAERFVVEIKTTAALQHPHILPLFDSGEAGGFLYYVMPFIDGETLRAKLDRETQLGVDEAVRIAGDVASALHYAHEHGVIHRDIKPENILLHDGRPMVADFGIALAVSAAAGGRMTETGLSLGTPHYMSPEQATAEKEITARSDVYSLGSVLYEMLTGEPPHMGTSAQQIIMKIITEDAAPVTRLRKAVPPNVAAAVAQSLQKLPADRFESARAFAEALANPAFQHGTGPVGMVADHRVSRWRDPVTLGLGAAAVLAASVAVWALGRPQPDAPVGRYAVVLDSLARMPYRGNLTAPRLALTPDGSKLVYVGRSAPGANVMDDQLFLRPLADLEARPIPGTAGAVEPAISPDGLLVAFIHVGGDGALRVAPLDGGPVLTLVESEFESAPAWGPGGFVYFLGDSGRIRRIHGRGGPVEDVTTLPALPRGERYHWLRILPGGAGALVGSRPNANEEYSSWVIHAVDLATGEVDASLAGMAGEYLPEAGALVYVAGDGSLMTVSFDLDRRQPEGRPQALFDGLSVRAGGPDLAVGGGNLAFVLAGIGGQEVISWVDRAGGEPQPVDPGWSDIEFEAFTLSPDGSRLAISIEGGGTGSRAGTSRIDVWIKQLDRGPISRLTFGGEHNYAPSWTPDGQYITYVSERDGQASLWRRRADGVGAEELVVDAGRSILEARWSPDGQWLVVSAGGFPSTDILAMRVGADTALRPLLAEPGYAEAKPSFSPDGRWLAYVSMESGSPQVLVRPFPEVAAGKWQISLEGGSDPVWSADGRELFFRSAGGQSVLAGDMRNGPGRAVVTVVRTATAGRSWEWNGLDRMFAASRDGRRFLVSVNATEDRSGDMVIVQNFLTELRTALAQSRQAP